MAQEDDQEQPSRDWKTIISPNHWKNSLSSLFRDKGVVVPSLQNVSFSKATETIGRQVKESAKELGGLFSAQECPQGECTEAPWEVLTAREKPFAKEIEERIRKITRDCYHSRKEREEMFLSLSSLKDNGFHWSGLSSEKMKKAMAALEKDPVLPDLRAGLVPRKMNEENFWRQYFYLVEKVKKTVVASSQFELFDEWENWNDTTETGNSTVEHSEETSDLDKEVDQVFKDVLKKHE